MEIEINRKKEWIGLTVGYIGAMAGLLGMAAYNYYVLMSLSMGMRMFFTALVRGLLMLVPVIVMIVSRDKLKDYGFTKDKLGIQIGLGVLLGIVMSIVFTLIPMLSGAGAMFDNGRRYKLLWQFAYEFIYFQAVGLSEEFVFRGFIYEKVKRLSGKEGMAVIVSSILFGFMHLLGGNMVQVFLTAMLGVLFCAFRLKIKNCTLLTLIILHGVYDFLITVWSSLLLA
jgi:hypothetical protein